MLLDSQNRYHSSSVEKEFKKHRYTNASHIKHCQQNHTGEVPCDTRLAPFPPTKYQNPVPKIGAMQFQGNTKTMREDQCQTVRSKQCKMRRLAIQNRTRGTLGRAEDIPWRQGILNAIPTLVSIHSVDYSGHRRSVSSPPPPPPPPSPSSLLSLMWTLSLRAASIGPRGRHAPRRCTRWQPR